MTCYTCGNHNDTLRPVTITYLNRPVSQINPANFAEARVVVKVLCADCIHKLVDNKDIESFIVHKLNMFNE